MGATYYNDEYDDKDITDFSTKELKEELLARGETDFVSNFSWFETYMRMGKLDSAFHELVKLHPELAKYESQFQKKLTTL